MTDDYKNDPMLEVYIFETSQMIEQLEQLLITSEDEGGYSTDVINEIFRIMHTIKGSSAMMLFDKVAELAHSVEDLFFFIRDQKPQGLDFSKVNDMVFSCLDFIKVELVKIKNGDEVDGDPSKLIGDLKILLSSISGQESVDKVIADKNDVQEVVQQYYISSARPQSEDVKKTFLAKIYFEKDCGMENLRAFSVLKLLDEVGDDYLYEPKNIDDDRSVEIIKTDGFKIYINTSKNFDEVQNILNNAIFVEKIDLSEIQNEEYEDKKNVETINIPENNPVKIPSPSCQVDVEKAEKEHVSLEHQNIINVSVSKLDKLMDLVGEMVIAEAMVVQNPDLKDLDLQNFYKSARQLNKITTELQDIVMAVRMVPLTGTFQKMNRTVRDMCKKLGKEVKLKLVGEETEVDKNIIEHISDPLMHLIRNSIDHGIEMPGYRESVGKPRAGTVTLEAKNSGSDVLIIISDDGNGLDREKILAKAQKNGILNKNPESLTEREIYNLIMLPGFSTNEEITEFSGRGVGMDVVRNNIDKVGGTIEVDSLAGSGTTIVLKIPLTLAIIDGMNLKVGDTRFTLPINTIKESFRPKDSDLIKDPNNVEMLMVRGQCYPILRMHSHFKIETDITSLSEGIIVMLEQDGKSICLFADELIGQQQVVVKSLPKYIKNLKHISELAGCTLLGDGSISLILDVNGLVAS
ncbi:chemotaxis protein CheA [Thermodesulfobium sp. 4217-1]|uniref:chemotaxis protein CheA n=1 Tax=Thermodesulfobium sp. 4217-1 TaxID=3120013 RepID=UPI003221B76E